MPNIGSEVKEDSATREQEAQRQEVEEPQKKDERGMTSGPHPVADGGGRSWATRDQSQHEGHGREVQILGKEVRPQYLTKVVGMAVDTVEVGLAMADDGTTTFTMFRRRRLVALYSIDLL